MTTLTASIGRRLPLMASGLIAEARMLDVANAFDGLSATLGDILGLMKDGGE